MTVLADVSSPSPRQARLRAAIAAHYLWLMGARLVLLAVKAGFNPDEPRIPAGNSDGGKWTYGLDKKPKNTDPSRFTKDHQAEAAIVAQQLRVPTENVLGLSGIESYWGTSNAAIHANNFFGLHGGGNAPFAVGIWYTSKGVAMSRFSSYLDSAKSFAAQYGSYVAGVSDPTAFAQALVKAGFNSGKAPGGNPNFVQSTAATIVAARRRMK